MLPQYAQQPPVVGTCSSPPGCPQAGRSTLVAATPELSALYFTERCQSNQYIPAQLLPQSGYAKLCG